MSLLTELDQKRNAASAKLTEATKVLNQAKDAKELAFQEWLEAEKAYTLEQVKQELKEPSNNT